MKRRITKLSLALIAVALLLCVIPMSALAAQSGDYTYTVSNGKATITGYTGDGGDIMIPSKLGGYPVTAIGKEAFCYNSTLSGVTILSGVTSIGEKAFFRCGGLTSLTIAGSVGKIGDAAFYGCGMTNLTIPNGVTTIGKEAFSLSSLTSVAIPISVTNIGESAFFACYSLTSVTIPNSVTSIGVNAFAACGELSAIHVNTSNQKYSDKDGVLFNKAKTVLVQYPAGRAGEAYVIPTSVASIGAGAFCECDDLKNLTIPGSVTSIGKEAFLECRSLLSIMIPSSVTSIGADAFSYCDGLTSIMIPGSVASIEEGAFSVCRDLASVTIANGVVSIGKDAFYGCWSLTSITIPASVTSIGAGAFGSNGLTAIHVSLANQKYSGVDGVLFSKAKTELVQYPSSHARTYYRIPDGVTGIWPWSFNNSRYLKSVMIPGCAASIGEGAFYGCGLTSVTISSGVTSIGKDAFTYCGNLTSVTIPASVTSIAELAFDGCGLKNAFFQGNAPAMGKYVFTGEPGFTVYYIKGKTGFTNPWYGYPTVAIAVPAVPVSLTAASASYNSIRLTWGAVAGATKYEVWRATVSGGTFYKLSDTAAPSLTNTNLTTGKTYYYKVRAYRQIGTIKVYGNYSSVVSAKPALATPTGVNAARASATSIKVSWNAVAGATKYEVWRATTSGGTFYKLPDTTAPSCTNTGLTTGKTYYYKLRAYRTVGTVKVYSDYSGTVSAKP